MTKIVIYVIIEEIPHAELAEGKMRKKNLPRRGRGGTRSYTEEEGRGRKVTDN